MGRVNKKQYRKILCIALFFNLCSIVAVYYWQVDRSIPNEIYMFAGENQSIDFEAPAIGVFADRASRVKGDIKYDFSKPCSMQIEDKGSYQMTIKLLGFLTLKNVSVNVIDRTRVIPGGQNIGIYVKTKGVMVLGSGTLTGSDGMKYRPADHIIKSGDYILAVNGQAITKTEDLANEVEKSEGKKVNLTVLREQEEQNLSIDPVKTSKGEFKLGIWVRDDTQGVGTLTFIGEDGVFGALGHGITDTDTGCLIDMDEGSVFRTQIVRIIKGEKGKPGEIEGIINCSEQNKIGSLLKNTSHGIFGSLTGEGYAWKEDEAVSIANKQEVTLGAATILCQLEDEVEAYEIEIEKIRWNTDTDSKGMVIRITDQRLLSKTNGIIQGMSGSPILQNGKLIGAVTHVFVQDSTKGYGIFIENMLKK